MSAPAISNADMLEIQLRKWISKRHVQNIKLDPAYSHPLVPKGQTVIAEVVDRAGQGLFFTGYGFTLPGRGFVSYDNIKKASWMSAQRGLVTPARKRGEFDRIEFSLQDGSSVMLTDVDKAVFPLLRFFEWLISRRVEKTE